MSPGPTPVLLDAGGFPRVSGDEPDTVAELWIDGQFSPRERG